MATIGQSLNSPESGWKRILRTDTNFTYIGGWDFTNGSYYRSGPSIANKIQFNFIGTELRLMGFTTTNSDAYSSNAIISIDNIEYSYSYIGPYYYDNALVFQKLSLDNKEHFVQIYAKDAKVLILESIDINAAVMIKPYNALINSTFRLLKTIDNKCYGLTSS